MDKGLKEKILGLRRQGKTYDEIVGILNCAKSSIAYHCKKNGLTNIGLTREKLSEEVIKGIREYYLNNTLKNTAAKYGVSVPTVVRHVDNKSLPPMGKAERKRRNIQSVISRRRKIKSMAIEYKGGECVRCGYNKYNGALEFHHLDPKEKDFSVSTSGHCKSWEKVKKELDKCILVCSNCHREIHGEQYI